MGAELSEGSGSRVRIALNGVKAIFHRPHPILITAGVKPWWNIKDI